MKPTLIHRRLLSPTLAFGLYTLSISLSSPSASYGSVVRPAPDFSVQVGDKSRSLKSFQGQQIILLLADSPSHRGFRRQVKELESAYHSFASNRVLFVAAFRSDSTVPVASNIPFLVTPAGSATCSAYGLQSGFSIAILGADGNLDYQTTQELTANRIREVLQNSFTIQQAARR